MDSACSSCCFYSEPSQLARSLGSGGAVHFFVKWNNLTLNRKFEMERSDRLSLRQACYLAIIVLVVYYPLSLYANVPFDALIKGSWIFVFLAVVSFVFYTILIFVFDRFTDWADDKFGIHLLTGFRFRTFLFCVPFAIAAVAFSQFLFSNSFRGISMVMNEQKKFEKRQAELTLGEKEQWRKWQRMNDAMTFVIALSIFYLTINRKANIKMKDMEVQAEQLKKENAFAQYEALKNQVSPHFLFNSLSILSSLVHVDAELSGKFIDQLSRAYRYILEQKDNDTVSLKTEIDFIKAYAFLLKIRFENKFELKIEIADDIANKFRIAPLTLQLLVENAVKHNRMSAKEPLIVSVSTDRTFLSVSNPVQERTEHERISSTGIGLKNIDNRYKLLTNQPVQIENVNGNFVVKIPLLS